jgi:putative transposase
MPNESATMPRKPRLSIPGQPQHVIQRGNNRQPIFVVDDDYRQFADMLALAADKHDCQIHAYVLMTNHVHLLATPRNDDGIGKMMQSLGRRYVQYFNFRNARTGTLWEGRYRATLVDTEQYLFACMRYIELNPVRAGMVTLPGEYRWSSFRCNAFGALDKLVTHHPQYLSLGASSPARQRAYRTLFDAEIEEASVDEIRRATNSAWVLGDVDFAETVVSRLNRRVTPVGRGGDRRSASFRNPIKRL